ncbi:MAG TPA: nitroreductase [Saprospiraceae bacterium]|nr:nitroreductase [Saprospiraceae bacterium]
MNEKFLILSEIIQSRRSIFPQHYKPGQIAPEILEAILENARWAPNHKKTEPWRFVVIRGEALGALSQFMMDHYKNSTAPDQFDAVKMKKAGEKPMQSSVALAICIQRSPESLIPAWEETAALACAVQNIWLGCSAMGIGSYWSTPGVIAHLKGFLGLGPAEECLGLFFMGWSDFQSPQPVRKPLSEICRILE